MKYSIPKDKLLHILVGFVTAVTLGYFISPLIAALTVYAVSAVKECNDEGDPSNHTKDWLDMEATRAGGALGIVLLLLLL
jgi:hypothetical protein